MKALITGASGMLGQDLCPTFEDYGFDLVETDIKELDVTNYETAEKLIKKANPTVVVHLAAYTNVENAEIEPEKAFIVNSIGTKNIAKISGMLDIPVIYISTDYVFDGNKKTPYLPVDKPNPLNIYGKSKLEGEAAIQKYCKKFYIARTSWLYGHSGKNFVDTMLSMKNKEEIKVVNNQIGSPTWTMDLSDAILKLFDLPYGIYHLSGGGKPVSWHDFAKTIFEYANVKVNLVPCLDSEYSGKAERPKYSYMENNKMLRNWKIALREYLNLYY